MELLFKKGQNQTFIPHKDTCDVCGKLLIGRGTKYKNPDTQGYLCRKHAEQKGISVFKPYLLKHLCLLILPLLLLNGCVESGIYYSPGEVTIPVTISEQGISVEVSDIQINNFRAAASVTAVYAITNNTSAIVTPDIYVNTNITPGDYEKAADYELCPESALSWLNIPAIPDIRPGESVDIQVIFKSPIFLGDIPNKYTFRTGIASGKGGLFQTAVETWWLVDMR